MVMCHFPKQKQTDLSSEHNEVTWHPQKQKASILAQPLLRMAEGFGAKSWKEGPESYITAVSPPAEQLTVLPPNNRRIQQLPLTGQVLQKDMRRQN